MYGIHSYKIEKKLGDGIYAISTYDRLRVKGNRSQRCLWTLAKMRGDKKCSMTGKVIKSGEKAYLPITNATFRADRISIECMRELEKEDKK